MFNVEKLLGKIVKEAIGGRGGQSSIIDNLASGGGLMTAIGLGIGAFEILRDKQTHTADPPPPPRPGVPHATPPPPPPGKNQRTPPPPVPPLPVDSLEESELAVRIIQVIIAAANADGILDDNEKEAILKQFKKAELSQEEINFLLLEMHNPKSIEELTAGIDNPDIGKVMYNLAVQCVPIDTEAERKWFDQLARALSLADEIKKHIEKNAKNRTD